MVVFIVIIFIISLVCLAFSCHMIKKVHQVNKEVDKKNKDLEDKNEELEGLYKLKKDEYNKLEYQIQIAEQTLDTQKNFFKDQEELSKKAFENYCQLLEKNLDEKEEEYDMYKDSMKTSYAALQSKLIQETENIQKELKKIKETRVAATEAIRREKEIEQKLSFYCLQVNDNDLKDISILDSIKVKLNNPRILSMLIWQSYFRKPMTILCTNLTGDKTKTGIYKITNIKTKECYIGQAINITERFKQHAKCGLGIDTPAANKLYKAMQEYGIWNFSWEILEECLKEELNEKEKYYIELYDSKNFGYNSINGIKNK